MSNYTAYAAATAHLAAAVVRHIADGLTLIGETLSPTRHVTITLGTTREEWCENCRQMHAAATVYAYGADPTDASPVGEWVDCEAWDDDQEDA